MAATISGPQVSAFVQFLAGVAGATGSLTYNQNVSQALAVGNAAGQANKAYQAALTVTSGTPLVVDLASLTDANGATITFAHVTTVIITNGSTTTGQDLTIGAGTNPLSVNITGVASANGGFMISHNPAVGYVYNSSTAHTIQIVVAAGTSVPLTITILGRDA